MGPRILNVVPRWILNPLTKMAMASKDRKAKGDAVTMPTLALTPHHDLQLVVEMEGALERFSASSLSAEGLPPGGSRSPEYFCVALASIETIVPHARAN